MTIHTLIVDDEKPARDELAFLLKSFPDVHLVGQGKNGVEALALIKEHSPDLVFLDVQMPGLNGFGVIKKLMDRKGKLPQIVFATAFDNYAAKAPPVKLLVKTQQRLFLVDAEDVIFASIEDGTITVVTREVEGTSNYRTIEELQSTLESDVFWRAHRSYLVNINHIKEVVPWFKSSYMLKMDDKRASEVPVSRAQTRHLRELLKM
jgi:two-component system LytT family response regulator/two-component system response regulator LytT